MQISIDNVAVQNAIDSSVSKAIEQAVGGYSVSKAIGEKIAEQVISGAIGDALAKALEQVDTEQLVKSLSEQIQRTTTAAVCKLVLESMVETIMKLRGKNAYSDGYQAERAAVYAELSKSI